MLVGRIIRFYLFNLSFVLKLFQQYLVQLLLISFLIVSISVLINPLTVCNNFEELIVIFSLIGSFVELLCSFNGDPFSACFSSPFIPAILVHKFFCTITFKVINQFA